MNAWSRRGAQLMVVFSGGFLLGGCAATVSSGPGPEEGSREVQVGVRGGGRPAARGAQQSFDRSRPPRVAEPPALDLPEVEDYTLPNGLRVVLVERPALPLVSLELVFPGGASAHPAQKAGLASLTAEMIDEGTEERTALEIADALDFLGASFFTTAGYDDARVGLTVLSGKFEDALDIVAEVVTRPSFPQAELDRVKAERAARILQLRDVPGALADNAFARILYGDDHPYGAPLIGTAASLEGLTRDDAVAFHGDRYRPDGATLIVAGDVERDELDRLLEKAFAGWTGAQRAAAPPAPPAAGPAPGIYLVDRPGSAQSEVRVGRVSLPRATNDYFVAMVTNTVLGGSFTSRLNSNLREDKGYTYGARSFFDMRQAPGPFEASAAVATPVTAPSVVEFVKEIRGMSEAPVPEDELARARNYLALRLPQRFETVSDIVARLSELVRFGLPLDFFEGYVPGVLDVDADAVRAFAARALPVDDMVIVIAGDRAKVEEPLRALGLGPVTVLERSAEEAPDADEAPAGAEDAPMGAEAAPSGRAGGRTSGSSAP